MSIMTCDNCEKLIDTDNNTTYELDGYIVCEECYDNKVCGVE